MKRVNFLLTLTLISAFVLRLYQLGKTPIALEWDEVAIGYDAYSILTTGRDQFGKFLPLTFRSLDDWKPPIYEYLTVPSIAVFGVNPFAVRLPSALSGILTVLVTYLLTKVIFKQNTVALLAAFFLAVSPWHLQFSRAAFEVNLSVAITVFAALLFLKGLKNPRLFLLSGLLFGLDLFSYHSTRVVGPLLMGLMFLLFNRSLPKRLYIILFFIIFGVFFAIVLPILTSSEAQIRFKATNIFDPGARYLDEKDLPKIYLDSRLQDQAAGFELAGKLFHNQRLIYTDYETLKKAFYKYLSHFNFEFLFIRGDAPLHHAPSFGLLYLAELPLLVTGLIYMVRHRKNRYFLLILSWLLIAPIPASVTRDAPHAVRTELILPMFQIITAAGLVVILKFIKKESNWVLWFTLISINLLFVINNSFYLHQYYTHTNYELSQNWKYGREEAVNFTESMKNNYDKILVSLKVDMPYIFWLFYSQYPPIQYLREGGTVSGGFADERNKFGKYEFRNFDYRNFIASGKTLFVGTPGDFPIDSNILKTIYYLDGTEAIKIAEK